MADKTHYKELYESITDALNGCGHDFGCFDSTKDRIDLIVREHNTLHSMCSEFKTQFNEIKSEEYQENRKHDLREEYHEEMKAYAARLKSLIESAILSLSLNNKEEAMASLIKFRDRE